LFAIEGLDFREGAREDLVAAVLGEKDGDSGVAELSDELVVAGAGEGGLGAAPGVRI